MLLVFLAPVAFADGIGDPSTVERITPAELKAKMDRGERIVIIDARSRGAYNHSDLRIKGDRRIAPDEIIERAHELPMGAEIIAYCT
jgi:rhodanese-related sulfurtransferase